MTTLRIMIRILHERSAGTNGASHEKTPGLENNPVRGFFVWRKNDSVLGDFFFAGAEFAHQPHQRIVEAVDDPFLQRNDGVVGDADVFRACFGAATGDVAQARSALVLDFLNAVVGVEGVHVKAGQAHHESGTGEVLLGFAVTQDVAGVLTEEALHQPRQTLANEILKSR